MAVVSLLKGVPTNAQQLDRNQELEGICQAFLGIEQPKTLEELQPHWVSPVHRWFTMRTKEELTDIPVVRLKFHVIFRKVPEYIAKTCGWPTR